MSFLSREEVEDRDMSSSVSPKIDTSAWDAGSAGSSSASAPDPEAPSGVFSGGGRAAVREKLQTDKNKKLWVK